MLNQTENKIVDKAAVPVAAPVAVPATAPVAAPTTNKVEGKVAGNVANEVANKGAEDKFCVNEFNYVNFDELLKVAQGFADCKARFAGVTGLRGEKPGETELVYSWVDSEYDTSGVICNVTDYNYSVTVPQGTVVKSLSDIFCHAFIFENEIADLYGVEFEGLLIDYQNKYYKTKTKFPMAEIAAKEASNG